MSGNTTESRPWYQEPRGQKHGKLFEYLTTLENRQAYRERENVTNLGLYEDREVMGVAPGLYVRPQGIASDINRVSLNITGSLCDTAANKISQSKDLPMALTEGGDWSLQEKAKELNKFLEGSFRSLSVFPTKQDSFGDCTIFGTGFIYVDRDNKDIITERVFPNEMLVDDSLCEFSDPWEMTRRKYIPRDKLRKMFPSKRKDIDDAEPAKLSGVRGINYQADLVPVYMTWRLPTFKRRTRAGMETDGLRMVIISTATLQEERYDKDYLPFVPMRWRKQKVGYFGRGIPSMGHKIQSDINKTVRALAKGVHLGAVPRLLLENSSNVNIEHLNNEVGSGIWYSQNAPQWLQGQMIPPEGRQYLEFLIAQYYQLIGISELAAGMRKPAGLNSGEAQRVYADTQADRFALPSQTYQDASLEIGKRIIGAARDIAEEYGDYEVIYHGKGFRKLISWKDIALEDDEYDLALSPINFLSKDAPDQLDKINDMMDKGLLSAKQAKKLLMYPDLEAVMQLENANDDITSEIIDQLATGKEAIQPDPAMDLKDSVRTVTLAKLHYQTLGLPDNRVKAFNDWIAQALVIDPDANPAQPTAPTPQGSPMPAGLPQAQPQMGAPAGLPQAQPQMGAPPTLAPG